MKLIIGYFAAICILLTGLSVFASLNAPAEAEPLEPVQADSLQDTSAEIAIPHQTRLHNDDAVIRSFII